MAVTKESAKVLRTKVTEINEDLLKLKSMLDPLIEKRSAYDAQINALQARINKLNEEKTNISKDFNGAEVRDI